MGHQENREINFKRSKDTKGHIRDISDNALECEIDFNPLVGEYVRNSVSNNTRRAYRADIEHFEDWGGTIPCQPEVIAEYLAAHAEQLATSTLKRRLAAISIAHGAKGIPTPTTATIVKATLRGLQRAHGSPQKQSTPLLLEELLRLVGVLGDSVKETRDKAMLLVGFAGGFRRSELVGLNVEDIRQVRQGMIITIRRSKTDQTGTGREVGIPFARGLHCPVNAIEAWLGLVQEETGPIFRPVTRHSHIGRQRLSGEAVSLVIKDRVELIGLDPAKYSGHSLRSGLATSAAMRGVSTLAIRNQTGHRSDAMLARYIRSGELFVNNAAGSLL